MLIIIPYDVILPIKLRSVLAPASWPNVDYMIYKIYFYMYINWQTIYRESRMNFRVFVDRTWFWQNNFYCEKKVRLKYLLIDEDTNNDTFINSRI